MFEERIAVLKSDLLSYGNEIVEHINSLYSSKRTKNNLIDLKNDPKSMIAMLSHEFSQLIQISKEQSEYAHVHLDAVEECSQLISLLDGLTAVVGRFVECEKTINKFKFVDACKIVSEIEVSLSQLTANTSSAIATGKVCSDLKSEHQRLSSKLQSKLKRALAECIRFEPGRVSVNRVLQGVLRSEDIVLEESVKLSELWEAVVSLHISDEFVADLSNDVWQYVLKPLWVEKKVQVPRAKNDGENGAELVFESIHKDNSRSSSSKDSKKGRPTLSPCKMPVSSLLDCVSVLLTFLWSEMIAGNEQVALSVHKLWTTPSTSLLEPLIESITGHLPKVESDLAGYKRTLDRPCKDLESKLALFNGGSSSGSASDGATADTPLSSYKISSIYADARRTEILRVAREIVLADYHNTMMAGGDALEDEPSSAGDIGNSKALLDQSGSFGLQKLKFDACQVSLTSNRILKLVHEVMKQACEASSKSIANVLVQSARDCLDIFIAVVPMKFSNVIDALPRMGGVFYNDCVYIAHNSVLITHKYRQELIKSDESFQGSIGFVDFIPRFRSVGEQCLRNHLEDQRMALSDLIRDIRITPDSEAAEAAAAAEEGSVVPSPADAIKVSASIFKEITNKIRNTSSTTSGSGKSGGGRGGVNGGAPINDEQNTLLLKKHLERLSEQWQGVLQEGVYCRIMGNLLNGILVELMQPVLVAGCVSVEASSEINRIYRTVQSIRSVFPSEYREEESLQTICPLWKKFVALTDLLDYSLGDVAEWLPKKKFSSFTGQEMTSLIKALFEDTDKRLQILQSILAMTS